MQALNYKSFKLQLNIYTRENALLSDIIQKNFILPLHILAKFLHNTQIFITVSTNVICIICKKEGNKIR